MSRWTREVKVTGPELVSTAKVLREDLVRAQLRRLLDALAELRARRLGGRRRLGRHLERPFRAAAASVRSERFVDVRAHLTQSLFARGVHGGHHERSGGVLHC